MLKAAVRQISKAACQLAILFIWLYQATFSKMFSLLGVTCRYYPSCSCYCKEAFSVYGFWKGLVMTIWRLFRCQPLSGGGFDPVVKKEKGI
jgi:uncharacterized protein